jgi:hypothetical protein
MGCDKDMVAAKGLKKKLLFGHLAKKVLIRAAECVHASRV